MSTKKLAGEDKVKILELYRQTPATTSTLAEQFGVSSSTISRLLKANLSNSEYEDLIQSKRLARGAKVESQLVLALTEEDSKAFIEPTPAESESASSLPDPAPSEPGAPPSLGPMLRTRKRRSSAQNRPEPEIEMASMESENPVDPEEPALESPKPIIKPRVLAPVIAKAAPFPLDEEIAPPEPSSRVAPPSVKDIDLSAIVKDLDDDLEDDDEDLEDEDLDEEDDEDEAWDDDENQGILSLGDEDIRVLPFAAAVFPPSCYLVIDRMAELIVRPLKEFAHLGKIPPEEVQQKTLPIFDNHRVARRFSNRFQKVIKVPDSRIFQKALPQLRSKGITRIFLDGKVYQLTNS